MEARGAPLNDHHARFALDNLLDGVKTDSLLVWQAFDTLDHRIVWIVGRKVKTTNETVSVLPLAILEPDSGAMVKRYAPALAPGQFDYSQIPKGVIITPNNFQSGVERR
jgi:hypothetical protein